ncbi:hypothetical protein PHLCEN_2v940 [Hermanssonia centrifuga]|uniref:DUF7770 domain-containing protein n=1 Tax=Hermanssonia centrifuga TaxID=98765 RepID=A0A2R6S4S5_9APHY|nr:hypothetical protein PHLCEN_2v940 [Hermanssonia centrifuga]
MAVHTIESEKLYSRHWNQTMSEIVVSGIPSEMREQGTGRQLIHWRVQATLIFPSTSELLSPGSNTVQCAIFDTVMAKDTGEVVIEIFSKRYRISQQSQAHPNFPLLDGVNLTPRGLLAIIQEKGLDKYKYNGEGSGCLYWCTQVIRHLEEVGIIGQGSQAN